MPTYSKRLFIPILTVALRVLTEQLGKPLKNKKPQPP